MGGRMSNQSYEQIWIDTLNRIQSMSFFSDDTYEHWILKKTTLHRIQDGIAYVSYHSTITANLVTRPESIEIFEEVLSEEWGQPVHIRFQHLSEIQKVMPEEIVKDRTTSMMRTEFNPEYTFENFVEGKSNQEAYSACLGSCDQNEPLFNPIMLYGNSGLGKTHLLHAVGNHIKKEKPNAKIFYAYSGDLVSILLDAMKTKNVYGNTVEIVQSQLIDNDYFLIDDIQNLIQSSSQEVFFKIYNALIDKKAQVILTSDMHPNMFKGMDYRLVSRFTNGLVINIQKPEFDTARAILRKKMEGHEDTSPISDEAIDFLAHKFSDDVRKLEGSLNRLIFNSVIEKRDVIDLDFAKRILSNEEIVSKPDKLTPKQIKKEVTSFYGLSYSSVEGKARQRNLVNARHMIVYLTRELLGTPWNTIGLELGNRDHSTIKSSYDRANKLLASDEAFRIAVDKIKSRLE